MYGCFLVIENKSVVSLCGKRNMVRNKGVELVNLRDKSSMTVCFGVCNTWFTFLFSVKTLTEIIKEFYLLFQRFAFERGFENTSSRCYATRCTIASLFSV